MSDIERQAIQQKIQQEIQAKKEQHLTVYKRSSLDETDDRASDMVSAQVEIPTGTSNRDAGRPRARQLKSLSELSSGSGEGAEQSDSDEEGEDAAEEDINIAENFKVLEGQVVEVELMKDPRLGLGLALAGHADRRRMGTFVCGVNPEGPAAKADVKLMSGDEVLKVSVVVRFQVTITHKLNARTKSHGMSSYEYGRWYV